jgi:DNA-directed RNA polymerase specialized sigma24 family protein
VNALPKTWILTHDGFEKFLLRLDIDRDAAGRRYELLHQKLVHYFDWRDCPFPEDHADEVLNRVIRKIDQGEEIRDVSTYVFGIAQMMLREIARTRAKEQAALGQLPLPDLGNVDDDETQHRIDMLRECLAALPTRDRELIIQYYEGDDGSAKIHRRRELARRLSIPLNALRIRACRLREKLERSMNQCLEMERQRARWSKGPLSN